ncbi:hypothetical protein GCM10009687_30040 [Asanoa iriomotensis]|uniref:Uncharacterized protein n=1 Tax=Asanoa iriomotensis TaxID=234613 RepID=A0ABQ4CDN9_9ACTN|nr:hypothetical protein Air01nite_66760 [Asanoa iriomotensis]
MPIITPTALCRFGGSKGPARLRLSDLGPEPMGLVVPTSPLDEIPGISTFTDPQRSGLSGTYWVLAAGTALPPGLDIHADGLDVGGLAPPGHRTIYAARPMSWEEFYEVDGELQWRYGGKIPRRRPAVG